jgi:pimeloyl-ACP methyl ester carboxylesterase
MNPYAANFLASISEASYKPTRNAFGSWKPNEVDEFKTYGFIARIGSDDQIICVSFRGTYISMESMESFIDTVWQFIVNSAYAQVVVNDEFRVHRGYWEALSFIADDLLNALIGHGIERKSLFVTGHSAGGAMATIFAWMLYRMGIFAETYVYSSPRVGDSNFSELFDPLIYEEPIFIRRFEYGYDPVPILFPPPPFLTELASDALQTLDTVIEDLERFFPIDLSAYKASGVEYIHTGPLFYGDPDNDSLVASISLGSLLGKMAGDAIEDWLYETFQLEKPDKAAQPWEEVPKEILDAMRGIECVQNIIHYANIGKIAEVLLHHRLLHYRRLLKSFQ